MKRNVNPEKSSRKASVQPFEALEIFSISSATRVAAIDASIVSSQPKKYADVNALNYYYALNSWVLLVRDISGLRASYYLEHWVREKGLIHALKVCDAAAAALSHGTEVPRDVLFLIEHLPLASALQVVRFLKRFSPLMTDKLEESGIQEWLQEEKRLKQFWRGRYDDKACFYSYATATNLILIRIKEQLQYLLGRYKSLIPHHRGLRIPTGSSFDWGRRYDLKLAAIMAAETTDMGYYYFGWTGAALASWLPQQRRPKAACDPSQIALTRCGATVPFVSPKFGSVIPRTPHFNRLIAVPKTYKKPRLVCLEEVLAQVRQRQIGLGIENAWPVAVRNQLPVHNQEISAEACGHFEDRIATIDISHASDSLAWRWVSDVLPSALLRDIDAWRPTHTLVPGQTDPHRLVQVATMGCGFTFPLMTSLFWAIARVACDLAGVAKRRYSLIKVMGDDVIIPDEAASCFSDVCSVLGIIINHDKSFSGADRYRESCGAEWWLNEDGSVMDVVTHYYPRFPIMDSHGKPFTTTEYDFVRDEWMVQTALTRLVSLQKNLYHVAPSTSHWLELVVRACEPRMTHSPVGTECSDLWGPFTTARCRPSRRITAHSAGNQFIPIALNPDTGLEEPANTRYAHLTAVTKPMTGTKVDPLVCQAYKEWKYRSFLEEGPSYSYAGTALHRTLVTDPPMSDISLMMGSQIEWSFREE